MRVGVAEPKAADRPRMGAFTSAATRIGRSCSQLVTALKVVPWFSASVRDLRAFRVEQWSDFTATVKG
ncbi:hypothetical protein [Methylorubrum extorquens]|uniref:hypothetical protein n=1 Tax=Methylorubrum extorquens TaxID=408 RepID=UPI000A919510|nr:MULTISPECIES: hypothetical protein [Methylobacteriaceae]MBA9069979.1 virulence-associated protein VapD [Methylobacterium sp. RAS18]